MGLGGFKLCEGNVFEIYGALPGENRHYFYQAEVDGPVFLIGVEYSLKDECLHRVLKDGIETKKSEPITEEEAQAILDAYPHKDFDWRPLTKYGEPVTSEKYIEKIVRDPATLYWGHVVAGQEGKTVTKETAAAVRNSYHPIELDWKPFGKYPFR